MKVLLVSNQGSSNEKMYPLFLGTIAAVLRRAGHAVRGLDVDIAEQGKVVDIFQEPDHDMIVFWLTPNNVQAVSRLLEKKTLVGPGVFVACGPAATVMRESLLKECGRIDYIVVGEPEQTLCSLANALEAGKDLCDVSGLIYIMAGDVVTTSPRQELKVLDELPFADRDVFPIYDYKGMVCKNNEYTQLLTGRGCPHHCQYCLEPVIWEGIRTRTAGNVVDEIEGIVKRYHIREFHFEDANFFAGNTQRVREICAEIISRGLNIDWQCAGVVPLAEIQDLSVLELMARAGCYNLSLGVETFDDDLACSVGREQSSQKVRDIVGRCKALGMEVSCHLMLGFPSQGEAQLQQAIRQSRRYAFDFIHYNLFQPIPGTPLAEALGVRDFSQFGESHTIFAAARRWQRFAVLRLAFKPSVIRFVFRRLFQGKNFLSISRKWFGYMFKKQTVHVV